MSKVYISAGSFNGRPMFEYRDESCPEGKPLDSYGKWKAGLLKRYRSYIEAVANGKAPKPKNGDRVEYLNTEDENRLCIKLTDDNGRYWMFQRKKAQRYVPFLDQNDTFAETGVVPVSKNGHAKSPKAKSSKKSPKKAVAV